MLVIDFSLYKGREQTGVKHLFLSEYLQRFAPIIRSWCKTITYVDCFSGPWQEQSEDLKDTSFSIALEELEKAREAAGGALNLRAFFVERDADAYRRLKDFADRRGTEARVEVETRHDELENRIEDIVRFVKAGPPKNFPFLFIDPTGWTGFGLEAIKPLLQLNPGEVLINFMTGHIRRLVEHPEEGQREGFEALYGSTRCARVLDRVEGKTGLEREDILVSEYLRAIRETGGYEHVSAAVVLNPSMDRTHFHLIFGTRNPKGLEVFKGAEKKAMEAMCQQRAVVQDRKGDQRQTGLFDMVNEIPRHDRHYQSLREHYGKLAQRRMRRDLESKRRVRYGELYSSVLTVPLTFESDLKQWLKEWSEQGLLKIDGLQGRERVPKLDGDHHVVWTGPAVTATIAS
ncbi:hypothetical protein DAT35_54880 [Vitiosangium sp. GDMCC 1.1324]|nr:hypothetical protein DAT35_54880 [Vitiosangium sp. GDMCC 1.1324]